MLRRKAITSAVAAYETPRWLSAPVELALPIKRRVSGPFTDEVAVQLVIDGDTVEALVPKNAVKRNLLFAMAIAEVGIDQTLIQFPGASMGPVRVTLSTERLMHYRVKP